METLDLKKRFAKLYKPSATAPALVDVPTLRFLMVDGVGGVGQPGDFTDGMAALYGLAYPVKFAAKKRLGVSYPVMPAEGIYWNADGSDEIDLGAGDEMAWRLMIMLPDEVSAEFVDDVRLAVAAKKDLRRLPDVKVQSFTEGRCVQMLHVGPYATEPETVERLARFIAEKGLEFSGRHHEIYLGDPNKSAPEKLKTVIRYPVKAAS